MLFGVCEVAIAKDLDEREMVKVKDLLVKEKRDD